MRILKHRNLLGCLFAFILAMPLINIGVRCAYTVFNKNAKDSYSGETTYQINYKYQSNEVNQQSDIKIGNIYHFKGMTNIEAYDLQSNFNFSGTILNDFPISYDSINDDYIDDTMIYSFTYVNVTYLEQETYININYSNGYYVDAQIEELGETIIRIDDINSQVPNAIYNYFEYTTYNEIESVDIDTSGTLDNAFSYSVSQITQGNNIGELKFFTWFADLFLDLDNLTNAFYVNFINWYFNYALLVSAVYILFLALMWFIMWVRRLLERGMDFGNRSW